MDSDGGSANTLVRCPRDDVDTLLQCSECGTPICPACFVRTPVGLRCAECGAGKPVLSVRTAGERRSPILAAVAVVVVLFVAAGAWAATRSSGGSAGDIGGGEQRAVVPLVQLGRGELPGGVTWTLEARRDGDVCTNLQTSPGPTMRERCQPVRAGRAINNTSTRVVRGPSSATYVTLALVSERVERVRVSSDGSEPREIATLGGDAGLGVRFFVTHTTENVDETYTALAADGTVLGRFDRPKMPNP